MCVFSRFWDQSFFIPTPSLTEKNLPDQTGRVLVITGGYAGCGRELAKILYQRNGTVYIVGRSKSKAETAIKGIKEAHPSSNGRLEFLELDLADLSTIKPAAEKLKKQERRLDVLTLNAGVMFPPVGSLSAQNHELQIATNALGHFLLAKLLAPLLERTAELPDTPAGSVRVTWAASLGVDVLSPKGGVTLDAEGNFLAAENDQQKNYGATKAANVFMASEFAHHHPLDSNGKGVISNSWNPGNLKSELQRHGSLLTHLLLGWILNPAIFGGYTELFAGWSEEAGRADKNAAYIIPWGRFGSFREDVKAEMEKEGGNAERFWEWCERVTREYC